MEQSGNQNIKEFKIYRASELNNQSIRESDDRRIR